MADAATYHKCKHDKAPRKNMTTFVKRIDWLLANNIIPNESQIRWEAIRYLRNASSHPIDQEISLQRKQ